MNCERQKNSERAKRFFPYTSRILTSKTGCARPYPASVINSNRLQPINKCSNNFDQFQSPSTSISSSPQVKSVAPPRRPVVFNDWQDDSQISESINNSLDNQSAAPSKHLTLNSTNNCSAPDTSPLTANKRSSPVVRIEEEVDETLHLAQPLENSGDNLAKVGEKNTDNNDQKELYLLLKIQAFVEQAIELQKSHPVSFFDETCEPSTKRIKVEAEYLEIRHQTNMQESSDIDKDTKEKVVKSCVQFSRLGQLSFDIGQRLSDKDGKFSESFLKEAEKRMKDAMSIALHWNLQRRAPENASYLLASSLRNQLAEYFRAAFAVHTKLQLGLNLFPINY